MSETKHIAHAALPTKPYSDERIAWIKRKVENSLATELEHAKEILEQLPNYDPNEKMDLFKDCLTRNNNENLQMLVDFLEDTFKSNTALLFWTEKVVSKVELPAQQDSKQNIVTETQVTEVKADGEVPQADEPQALETNPSMQTTEDIPSTEKLPESSEIDAVERD